MLDFEDEVKCSIFGIGCTGGVIGLLFIPGCLVIWIGDLIARMGG